MKSRTDYYVVKQKDLEKILGHKLVDILPMIKPPRNWSDVPVIRKPWGAYHLNYNQEYVLLTAATDNKFHFIKNGRIRHGIDSQYPEE